MRTTNYDFERLGYSFRYFFNAGVSDEGFADVEGYDVFQGEKYIASLPFLTKEEIEKMTEEELKININSRIMKHRKFTVVEWPYSQHLFEMEGFEDNCQLINCEKGLEDFGSSAYFVDTEFISCEEGFEDKYTYTLVDFPECQNYEELEGFDENSYYADDGGYFINTEWLNSQK
jgi:hypothetical protein